MAYINKSVDEFDKWVNQGSFARHETFCPRYGWLKKGFEGVNSDRSVFDSADAIERLGVGKNMVRAIRFWCVAFHLIIPLESRGKRFSFPRSAWERSGTLYVHLLAVPHLLSGSPGEVGFREIPVSLVRTGEGLNGCVSFFVTTQVNKLLLRDGGDIGLPGNGTGNGIQDIPCLFSCSGDIASNSGKLFSALQSAKAA